MKHPLDSLTVCITAHGPGHFLDRCLSSLKDAGIRRVTVAASCMEPRADRIIRKAEGDFPWFRVMRTAIDTGCNGQWLNACYLAETNWVLVMHSDDGLQRSFADAYRTQIAPALASGAAFASWRSELLYPDGRRHPTEHIYRPTGFYPTSELDPITRARGRLSLSPIISVFDRATVIRCAKESEDRLRHSDNWLHPGMLIGTESVCYLRSQQRPGPWHHTNAVLSFYGSHAASGTIQAELGLNGGIRRLAWGYDRAKAMAEGPAPLPTPRILLTTWVRTVRKGQEALRVGRAEESRQWLAGTGDVVLLKLGALDLPRTYRRPNGGTVPYLKDLLDAACAHALPEDIVVYANDDLGFTVDAPARIRAAIDRGRGVSCLARRSHTRPEAIMRRLHNAHPDGGVDAIALTPKWWAENRSKLPDFLIGSDAWDLCFRVLAEEWADGGPPRETLLPDCKLWAEQSYAYDDLCCWHVPHVSRWIKERHSGKGDGAGRHNRRLAREFFSDRHNQDGLRLVAESAARKGKRIER